MDCTAAVAILLGTVAGKNRVSNGYRAVFCIDGAAAVLSCTVAGKCAADNCQWAVMIVYAAS